MNVSKEMIEMYMAHCQELLEKKAEKYRHVKDENTELKAALRRAQRQQKAINNRKRKETAAAATTTTGSGSGSEGEDAAELRARLEEIEAEKYGLVRKIEALQKLKDEKYKDEARQEMFRLWQQEVVKTYHLKKKYESEKRYAKQLQRYIDEFIRGTAQDQNKDEHHHHHHQGGSVAGARVHKGSHDYVCVPYCTVLRHKN